ncbi:MAG: putative hydrolase or acyltransferases (alpha/beta hydrolase superfamily) [Haloquadratum sp. J07HQX50]|nr:MAG: putative hydrolase or acyltransferases (alpha/beta hydrolase superfamily) [Haloquadratum sp. J07HQX50]
MYVMYETTECIRPADVHLHGKSSHIDANGTTLHVVEAGPPTGEVIVLLHGFPEFWYQWREYIEPLAAEGFRVLVPDQRGYHLSGKPSGLHSYLPKAMVSDLNSVIQSADVTSAHVVGHDWGAIIGWWSALSIPDKIDSLTVINAPHPEAFRRYIRSHPSQLLRNGYALLFQLPSIPERVACLQDWRLVTEMMDRTSRKNTFSAHDFAAYRTAWEREDAYSFMLNWYRAVGRFIPRPPQHLVTVPTQLLWGTEDSFLEQPLAAASAQWGEKISVKLVDRATHWLPHEHPKYVRQQIVSHVDSDSNSEPE